MARKDRTVASGFPMLLLFLFSGTSMLILEARTRFVLGFSSCRESPLVRCGLEGFTKSPTEHMIIERHEPFRVRVVEGIITSETGGWPEDSRVLFEIRPLGKSASVQRTEADSQGVFKMQDVAPGEYCFKATADGWQSVVGILIVTTEADPENKITFEMLLGV